MHHIILISLTVIASSNDPGIPFYVCPSSVTDCKREYKKKVGFVTGK